MPWTAWYKDVRNPEIDLGGNRLEIMNIELLKMSAAFRANRNVMRNANSLLLIVKKHDATSLRLSGDTRLLIEFELHCPGDPAGNCCRNGRAFSPDSLTSPGN